MADFSTSGPDADLDHSNARNPAETIVFLLDSGGSGPPPDVDAPSVTITTPSALTSRTAPVLFEVLDASPLARVFVAARFTSAGRTELIYDGITFHAPYVASTRVGNAFTVRRTGGWPSGFSLSVGAVDNSGNAV